MDATSIRTTRKINLLDENKVRLRRGRLISLVGPGISASLCGQTQPLGRPQTSGRFQQKAFVNKLLLSQVDYGADVNVRGEDRLTPLHYAARFKIQPLSASKAGNTGLVSTYITDSGIKRVLDISRLSSGHCSAVNNLLHRRRRGKRPAQQGGWGRACGSCDQVRPRSLRGFSMSSAGFCTPMGRMLMVGTSMV